MARKFVFSLESLKKIRHHKLALARRALSEIDLQITQRRDQLNQSQREIRHLLDDLRRANASVVKLLSGLIESERVRIRRVEEELRTLEKERAQAVAWVAECGKEHKALEKLEEKKRQAHEQEQLLKEKRMMDQLLSDRYARILASKDEEL